MSVIRMIIADDRHYVSGEPHGSDAMRIYAACSRNPKSLEELDRLLPEFDSDEEGRAFSSWNDGIELEPFDAGLIIVDLAKKWIYAQDSYFGAYRRGSYQPRDQEDRTIEYEFSKEWQFVAEPKWFRYLASLGLQPYGGTHGPAYEKTEYEGFSEGDLEFDDDVEFDDDDDDEESTPSFAREDWGEIYVSDDNYTNRITSMCDFNPQNAEEERDEQTLKHIARYDNEANTAQKRIENAQQEIASLKIELQAVENLRQRDSVPRWEIKRIKLQASIGKYDEGLSHWTEDYTEAAAMAAELRNFLTTDKGRQMLKMWEAKAKEGWGDMELPF